jgi:hypothetical protein
MELMGCRGLMEYRVQQGLTELKEFKVFKVFKDLLALTEHRVLTSILT